MFRRSNSSPNNAADSESEQRPDLKQLQRLFGYTKPYRTMLIVGVLAAAVSSGLGLIFPQFVGRFFDAFIGGSTLSGLNTIVLLLLLIFAVQAVFNFLRTYLLALAGEGVVADLRTTLYTHLLGLPLRFFENRKTGEITSRLTSDIATVQGAVSTALAQTVNQGVLLVGSVVLLFFTNWQLTLLMLTVVPVVVLGAAFFGRRLREISTEFQDLVADANASAEEAITGVRVVKSFTAEGLEAARYRDQVQASYRVARRRAAFRAFFVAGIFLAMFSAISIVLWYGGRLVLRDAISAGDLAEFLLYTLFVAGAVGSMTGLYSQFLEALGASKRIFELLDTGSDLPEVSTPKRLKNVKGEVRFDTVSFGYGDRGEENVLHDISLVARPGEVVALVGPSGAGKSTLVTLIPRFYDPVEGRILLDGTDLIELDPEELRRHVGIVPQETQLFSGTVRENIRYGRPEASDAEVEEAAQAANAHDFIRAFPEGYETVVGERGVKLSGGQRQRVAIARALLKNPRILILDEATSSLDSESEALVQEALETLMQGRTTFVIAHRLSTVNNADRILVLDGGRVLEQGTHAELMRTGGLYRNLYERQFRQDEVVVGD